MPSIFISSIVKKYQIKILKTESTIVLGLIVINYYIFVISYYYKTSLTPLIITSNIKANILR
jgi:hypothetical protein